MPSFLAFMAIYWGFVLFLVLVEKCAPRLYESVVGPIASVFVVAMMIGVLGLGLGNAGRNAIQDMRVARDNGIDLLVREFPRLSRREAQTLIEEMGLERALKVLKPETRTEARPEPTQVKAEAE